MSKTPDFSELPEGVFIDGEAIREEIERTVQKIITDIVEATREQVLLLAELDKEYASKGVPLHIREQASDRLGCMLSDITMHKAMDVLMDRDM